MATTVLGLKTFAASDPVDYNEINDNYNKIDNGVKTAFQGRAAQNLLDNSWFVNPINQRGATSYSSQGYSIDRWKSEIAGGTSFSISVSSGKLIISKSGGVFRFYQILNNDMLGKTVTYAVKTSDGIFSGTCVVSNTINDVRIGSHNAYLSVYSSGKTIFSIFFNDSSDDTIEIYCAALYEGSYTADTLPAYQPKGYAAELAECQRYYENSWFGVGKNETQEYIANVWSSAQADARIEFKQQKRISPTITFYPIGTESNWKIFNNGYQLAGSVENKGRGGLSGFIARVSKGSSDGTTWTIGDTIQAQGHWEASADL